jgi:hypothetical protein
MTGAVSNLVKQRSHFIKQVMHHIPQHRRLLSINFPFNELFDVAALFPARL